MRKILSMSLLMLFTNVMLAQQVSLSPSTQRWIHKADSILVLDVHQKDQLILIWQQYESAQQSLELRKQTNSQNSQLNPEQWEKEDAAIASEKKENKRWREEQIELLLTEPQKIVYQQQIAPNRSPVSHMGVKHDRANCNICVKP